MAILIAKGAVPVCTLTSNGGVLPLSHPLQHKLFSVFDLGHPEGVQWNLKVV